MTVGLYSGLGPDERPEQGKSPIPFLTLRELEEKIDFAEFQERFKRKALARRSGIPWGVPASNTCRKVSN